MANMEFLQTPPAHSGKETAGATPSGTHGAPAMAEAATPLTHSALAVAVAHSSVEVAVVVRAEKHPGPSRGP